MSPIHHWGLGAGADRMQNFFDASVRGRSRAPLTPLLVCSDSRSRDEARVGADIR